MMQNKLVAYMLFAVLIGVTLITGVPDQMARIASPRQIPIMESGDVKSITLNESETVELDWDSTADYDNESYVLNITGKGFADLSVNITASTDEEVHDLAFEISELEKQLGNVSGEFADVESSIADVESVASDAVNAAEAAEAVGVVASIANAPNDSVIATDASRKTRSTQSTLNLFMWYAFDALIAVGVYFLAKNRFG